MPIIDRPIIAAIGNQTAATVKNVQNNNQHHYINMSILAREIMSKITTATLIIPRIRSKRRIVTILGKKQGIPIT